MLIGTLTGVDLNMVGDNPAWLTNPGSGGFIVTGFAVSNASAQPSTSAKLGLFNQTGGVDPIGSAPGLHGLSASGLAVYETSAALEGVLTGASATVQVRVETANGAACTVDVAVFGEPLA